jgi:hypothetical protein
MLSLAIRSASASSSKAMAASTGPKISSRAIVASWPTPSNTVGSM